jgi:hypothetical protein
MNANAAAANFGPAIDSDRGLEARAAALVNPASGLANDYLNVFNELVMLVEHLPTMPELMANIAAWRPVAYRDYFAHSNLPGRQQALDAYERLDPVVRSQFEGLVEELDRCATGSVAAIRIQSRRAHGDAETLAPHCEKAATALHALLKRATELVDFGAAQAETTAQQRADRLLAARVHALRDVKAFMER